MEVKSFVTERSELESFQGHYREAIGLARQQSRFWHTMDLWRRGALDVVFFVREIMETNAKLRPSILERLRDTFYQIRWVEPGWWWWCISDGGGGGHMQVVVVVVVAQAGVWV